MKINFKLRKILLFLGFNLIFLAISAPFIVLWGPFQTLKAVTVSMVYTSRHPQFLKPFLTQAEIDQIMSSISQDVNLKQVITRKHFNLRFESGNHDLKILKVKASKVK